MRLICLAVMASALIACSRDGDATPPPTGEDSAAINPLSLAKMITFGGPEAEGFHDCFWIGPVSFESYNIAYPDEGAVYWGSKFIIPPDADHLEIDGAYPRARYFSFNVYDKLTQPTDALVDSAIEPYQGANPFADNDKRGGRYKVRVYPQVRPGQKAFPNDLHLTDASARNDELPLVMRIYVPEAGTDFTGGAGLPKVTLVMRDGKRLDGAAMCEALNSPAPGTPERKLPSVVVESATFEEHVYAPDAPPGFPASADPEWVRFWGGHVEMSRLLPDRTFFERAVAESAAGKLPKMSGFYANAHNEYIGAYVHRSFGDLVVIEGRMPRTPARGYDITSGDYDIRYWSICSNEGMVTTRYADCLYDSMIPLDDSRNYTIVVSKASDRPENAKAECGVAWLDWGERGDGHKDPDTGFLIVRNMLGTGFPHSVQNVSSILAAEADMGPYFPQVRYMGRADFEARGCAAGAPN